VLGLSYDDEGIQKIENNIKELLQKGFYP